MHFETDKGVFGTIGQIFTAPCEKYDAGRETEELC
jgi:hypothetical protein